MFVADGHTGHALTAGAVPLGNGGDEEMLGTGTLTLGTGALGWGTV